MRPQFALIVINLDRSSERLMQVREQLESRGLSFHRLAATDARTLPESERDRYYSAALNRSTHDQPLFPGEIACYISHLRAWQLILDQGWDYAVILEDDVRLAPNFEQALDQLASLPLDWDVMKLGSTSTKPIIKATPVGGGLTLCSYAKVPICTVGEAVSRRGAEKLLARRIPFGRPVDVDLQYTWETGIEVYGLEPYCTAPEEEAASEIWGSAPRKKREKNRWRSLVNRTRFSLASVIENSKRHGFAATAKTMLFGGRPHP